MDDEVIEKTLLTPEIICNSNFPLLIDEEETVLSTVDTIAIIKELILESVVSELSSKQMSSIAVTTAIIKIFVSMAGSSSSSVLIIVTRVSIRVMASLELVTSNYIL